MRILVTGASGFLGRAIVAAGAEAGHHMIAVNRSGAEVPGAADCQTCGDLAQGIGGINLSGVGSVIHCAALVHQPKAPPAAYQPMNVDLPVALAKAAREAGARRFIQISSVAAIASQTPEGMLLDDAAAPTPASAYGRSKLAADIALQELVGSGFDVVSLRPPALYGAGVGAPFAQLMKAARLGVPLPIGAIRSLRSFASVGNIADASIRAATAERRSIQSGSFIVTDSLPISAASLYSKLTEKHGHSGRVVHIPQGLVEPLAKAALGSRADSLLKGAAFNGARFVVAFGWRPAQSMDQALRRWVEEEQAARQ